MNFSRLYAIIKKEIRHILRDPRSFISAIVLPMVLMIIYCESLSLDVDNLPAVVMDHDKTYESRELINRFTSGGYFYITDFVDNYTAIQKSIDEGKSVVAIVIPRDFSKNIISSNSKPSVQILTDATDPNRASIASSYAQMIVREFSAAKQRQKAKIGKPFVSSETRIWFNQSLRSKNFIIPGLIALIMAILSALLTSTAISKEWENGTMELLISTPVSASEIILGKFIPYFLIGIIDAVILISAGFFIYHVPITGSLFLLTAVIILFLSLCIMFGLVLSSILKSSLAANIVSLLMMFLPTMLLSGFIFFVPAMPKPLQILSCLVPAKYFINCSRGIYAKGTGFDILWIDMLILALFFILLFIICVRKFRKKLD